MEANPPKVEFLYPSSEREGKFRCRLCTSSVHREIRHFHVVVVQWRQRNVQKCVLFCWLNLLLLWRSHCRRRRRILRSLLLRQWQSTDLPGDLLVIQHLSIPLSLTMQLPCHYWACKLGDHHLPWHHRYWGAHQGIYSQSVYQQMGVFHQQVTAPE